MRSYARILRWPVLVLIAGLTGCEMDFESLTEIAADGAVDRTVSFQLKDLERKKEAETYPAKRFRLPAAPAWTVLEDSEARLSVRIRAAPGQVVPGGYERNVPVLERTSGNAVRVTVRDHFVATSYDFVERYTDVVDSKEFRAAMLSEFDRATQRALDEAEKEFGAAHDLEPARRYVTKPLRKLYEDSADGVVRSGLWTAVTAAFMRLALGGFPLKASELANADPRDVLRMLLRHCLSKIQLKPEAVAGTPAADEEKKFENWCKELATGTVDQQASAKRALLEQGAFALRTLDKAARAARGSAPTSGAAVRLEETAAEIRTALSTHMESLVTRLAKEIEDYYLHPPPERKVEIEGLLARTLGAHIEGNFAPCDYMFLVRAKLPGELVSIDRLGHTLRDGTLRWNFTALDFYLREKTCAARSRVWKDANVEALSTALTGERKGLTLRARAEIEELLLKLDDAALAKVTAACQTCAQGQTPDALEKLTKDESSAPVAACAKRILELAASAKLSP